MKKITFVLLIAFISTACTQNTSKINGISLVSENSLLKENHIDGIKVSKANYVAVIPFAYTRSLNDTKVISSYKNQWFGESEVGVRQYISLLKKHKYHIMLKPQLWVLGGKYTGEISFEDEESWKEFQLNYTNYILAYAKMAEQLNVALFCIGTELDVFVRTRPLFWNTLIREVKKIYHGKLTYASNWDTYKEVSFWEELDFIGVDAYFPLSNDKTPNIVALSKSWQEISENLETYSSQKEKSVLFTEYGYRSMDFAAKEPWKTDNVNGVNLQSQYNCYEALYKTVWKEKWFAGGFLWKWFPDNEIAGGEKDNRFTPQNKPVIKLINDYYNF